MCQRRDTFQMSASAPDMRDRGTFLGLGLCGKEAPGYKIYDRKGRGHVAELVIGEMGGRDNLVLIQDQAEL